LAYTELVLPADVSNSSGKVLFKIIKGCKDKDYDKCNSSLEWQKLKNKFDPAFGFMLFKTAIPFNQIKLKEGNDPEVWITNLEDLHAFMPS
jgi:hypothetical protein